MSAESESWVKSIIRSLNEAFNGEVPGYQIYILPDAEDGTFEYQLRGWDTSLGLAGDYTGEIFHHKITVESIGYTPVDTLPEV